MKNATLRQLKVFEAVARLNSFSRAAEELHLTQPAVSTQVKTLQGHVGQPLFEQFGKKIFLTTAGTALLHHSRLIIRQFDEAEAAMARVKGVTGGPLNVAAISAGDYFLPRLLVEFARRHEGVKLNLVVNNRQDLLVQLADNLTDIAIMVRPPDDAQMVHEAFAPHPYVIVAPAGHALAGAARITMARLLREPFLVRERGSDSWLSMTEAFGRHITKIKVALEIKSTETIKQAVLAGMGITFLSGHTVSSELRAGTLVVLDVVGFPRRQHWYLVWRRGKRLPPAAQAFREFLQRDGARLIDEIVPVAAALPLR